MNIKVDGEIAEVRVKAYIVRNSLETFVLYVADPGMKDELLKMRRKIEEMETRIFADLREEERP